MGQCWGLDVDPATTAVLVALADHGDDHGNRVFPSVGYLAWKTGLHERTVQRIMRSLEQRGTLKRVRSPGYHRPTAYRLDLSVLPQKPPYRMGDTTPPFSEARVASESPKGGRVSPKGGPTPPEPSLTVSETSKRALASLEGQVPTEDLSVEQSREFIRQRLGNLGGLVKSVPEAVRR